MPRIIIVACLVLMLWGNSLNAVIQGVPLKDDEYAHIFTSAWVAQVCRENNFDFWQSSALMFGAGVAKELYDMRSTGFNTADIGLNMVGVILSYSVSDLIENLTGKTAQKKLSEPGPYLIISDTLISTANITLNP